MSHLYIVATPIGNLEDMTSRALNIFKEADAIVCEDTRHTLPLLSRYGISKPVLAYFEYSKKNRMEGILKRLSEGQSLALVTDAGTPAISDPGARLIAEARRRGISIVPIPGPSSIITCLSISGLPTEPFHFWGFLSPSASKRRKIYHQILTLEGSHGFFESPHKLTKHLDEWSNYFLDYNFFVAKELTKKFETHWFGKLKEVTEEIKQSEVRGEYTVILSKESF